MTLRNDRLPPRNREAEEAVLGSLLIDNDAILEVMGILRPSMFYGQVNKWAYEAILALHKRGEPLDSLTLIEELRRREKLEDVGGEPYVIGLVCAVPTSINARAYAKIVEAAAIRRALINYAGELAKMSWDEDYDINDIFPAHLKNITKLMSIGGGSGLLSLKETAELLLSNSERYYNDTSLVRAVPSFLPQLTNVLGGGDGAYWESELIILAARPGMGKTAWLIQELINAARLGHCPAFFSLEMPSTSIVARVVSQMTGLDARDITLGRLRDDEWKAYYNAVGNLSKWGAYLSDDVYSLNGIVNEIVKLASRQEVGIVFIDYLTLINSDERSQNKNAEVELMVRSIRQKIARELKVPVVLAAQLSRNVESRQDKRPMLSDLRDSGAIEQTADKVLFLYRDDYYNPDTSEKPGIAEVLVRKNRNGQNNIDIDVEWSGKTTQFIPLTKKEAFDENNP